VRKKIWLGLVLCLSVMTTGCRRSPDAIATFLTGRIGSYLGLDTEQQNRLDAVREEIFQARADTKEERSQLLGELRSQILSAEMDAGKLTELSERHRRMKQEKIVPRVLAKLIEFHKALTQEQKELIAHKLDTVE